ncbi:CDP-alcohol phosphatidyltransferase family protein [Microvirga sp. ACRRW]|uniref:CDP-alcohol phosphatidyltransferase family protein n=1 Tax=Microvirga sp. ACRRW TaxID=2918205 RepID=UPI001EF61169|nr:CDP-alcohol phosphatidyltransferase family protein [Microvirga sp. ACRRW]MCG7392350.1 CDP-alcohol phosphatidyltransferase family protein [Microvirga sp. ACRRW]
MATQPDECTGNAKSDARRPIAARSSGFAQKLTQALLKTSFTPNQISVASIAFAGFGALALAYAPAHPLLYLVAIAGIQLRLLCNLLDGMVAVEGGRGSPVGVLYNEIPDRIADTMLLVALGFAAGSPSLGWACALAAALTAYIRVFGGALGQVQDFRGPMAKQHRMALLTGACALALVEAFIWQERYVLLIAAWIILIGSLVTCVTRLKAVAGRIEEQP